MTRRIQQKVPAFRRTATFVATLSLGAIAAGAVSAQDLACQVFTEASNSVNANGPQKINQTTTQESTSVSCDTKTLDTTFTSTLPTPTATWKDENQKRLNTLYCGDPASADVIKNGWTIAETTVFADATTVTLKASCE